MRALNFDFVPSLTDHRVRVCVWRGPQGDYASGQEVDRPSGYAPADLTGAYIEMTIYENQDVIAVLKSNGDSPQLSVVPGVDGKVDVKFQPANFYGWPTGVYNHAMKCVFLGGKEATLWVGSLTLVSIPTP